ncbi:CMD domain protein [Paraburkholderia sp. UYCP14C]|uniref:CMD domain protein n=1 Tax=Paraburkholderia sp. UYCP14C TaxID=2511130 RepID=UPI0010222686|nr:CMD domain protein [Paraburkholderia sp. UYCP14C]RZF27325.1 CMD domain protein [Paraburkholderia sp. UYCP14C]
MSSSADSLSATATDDFVAQLAGLAPDGATAALRAFRGDATRYTQGSHDALFSTEVADLTLRERLYAAWYAALLSNAEQTALAYRERLLAPASAADAQTETTNSRLDAIAGQRAVALASIAKTEPRLAAILLHTEALTLRPAATGKPALSTLQAAGLTTRAIVALSQLVAFVTYQVRVVAALRALEAKA